MKKQMLLMILPVLLLLTLVWTNSLSGMQHEEATSTALAPAADHKAVPAGALPSNEAEINKPVNGSSTLNRHELVSYAMSFLGSPYVYAGMSPDGFDCSGFITYVYKHFDLELPHSSAMQAEEGEWISKTEAKRGDLVIFTGTNPAVREPGHVGIVISSPGDTIEFVHSSSNGGVKVSKVQGTRYDIRFLEVRRVL